MAHSPSVAHFIICKTENQLHISPKGPILQIYYSWILSHNVTLICRRTFTSTKHLCSHTVFSAPLGSTVPRPIVSKVRRKMGKRIRQEYTVYRKLTHYFTFGHFRRLLFVFKDGLSTWALWCSPLSPRSCTGRWTGSSPATVDDTYSTSDSVPVLTCPNYRIFINIDFRQNTVWILMAGLKAA